MHVVDPANYPLDAAAQYKPTPHTLQDAQRFYEGVGMDRMVFVQPSIYGNDNSCMLDALEELGTEKGRAVVQLDPETINPDTLRQWHGIGVRGVRINLVSVGKSMDAAELKSSLQQYADIIRPFGWVLQLFVPLKMAEDLEKIVPELDVKVCLDHFGKPTLSDGNPKPHDHPGFSSLIRLMKQGNTYVKISGAYRISQDPALRDLEPMAKELLGANGGKNVVFATDWPHTRFDGLDIKPFIGKVLDWCEDDKDLIDQLFRRNAEKLWDVQQ
jgi:predicted TIM-barrel fold metal-dependent hydrolase